MIQSDFQTLLSTLLGANLIDVELTANDYTTAFEMARRTYIQKGNNNQNHNFRELPVVAGTSSYVVDSSVDLVVRIINTKSFPTSDPFSMSLVQSMFSSISSSDGGLATYEMSLQYIENLDIYFVKNIPFDYNKRTNTLKLLKTPKIDETWMIETYDNSTDDEYRELLWIQEWALAELKIIIGRAYSKFASLSGPSGETSLNGDVYLSEGREDKDRLLFDIQNHVDGEMTGGQILIG
jgi:hypothetical protein